MAEVVIKYQRMGRKHVFYSDDLPGFSVADRDKKMAFYRVASELEEYLGKRDKKVHIATAPGAFDSVFGVNQQPQCCGETMEGDHGT